MKTVTKPLLTIMLLLAVSCSHYSHIKQALESGHHVLYESPLCLYSQEAELFVSCLKPFFSGHEPVIASCRNLLPSYKGWTSVAGDMLEGLRFGPFIDSLAALNLITLAQKDGDDDELSHHMRTIAMALYTPPSDGVKPPSLLVSHAVLFFSTVWQHITEQPVCINGEDIPFTILFTGSSASADDHTGWNGIAFEVAKQGVFGPMSSLREAPFWDVLLYLYKCRFENLHMLNFTSPRDITIIVQISMHKYNSSLN